MSLRNTTPKCVALMPERYRTIVADPPWDHSDGTGTIGTIGRGQARRPSPSGPRATTLPYAVMSLDEIKALPVRSIAEKDAHLYLWTTNRYLRHVWDVAEGWGFNGVCMLVWCKPASGFPTGGAWGANTEFCLFARRGNLQTVGRANGRWYQWPRRRGAGVQAGQERKSMHSAKPEAFLDHVEQVSPGPYVELFARRNRLGWDTWGDQSLGTAEMPDAA